MSCECGSRRQFIISGIGAVATAGVAVYGLGGCTTAGDGPYSLPGGTTVSIDLNDPANAPLRTVGGAVFIDDPGDADRPIIVFRAATDKVNAFSSRCTHQGGPVGLPNASGTATCPWHGSTFNTEGNVTGGPAATDLKRFAAAIEGERVVISIS